MKAGAVDFIEKPFASEAILDSLEAALLRLTALDQEDPAKVAAAAGFREDCAVVGGAAVLTQSLTNTKIQLSAPDALRGRVMGAYTFGTQGMRVLNGPILGGAAILFGAPAAVAGAAAVVLAGLGLILARVPQLKQDR